VVGIGGRRRLELAGDDRSVNYLRKEKG